MYYNYLLLKHCLNRLLELKLVTGDLVKISLAKITITAICLHELKAGVIRHTVGHLKLGTVEMKL
jgi:hypothetical protein